MTPALTVSLALAAGMLAQVLARHLRVPGIVILILAGILLGPDLLGVVQPEALGPALPVLIELAVAIILFEGGLALEWRRLRREALVIRRLISLGALLTAAGGALAAWAILGWGPTSALLFGTLVIVTGPTVVTPLLRRVKVKHGLATILEAEGVLIDAVGAIVAVVALEIAISPATAPLTHGLLDVPLRLGLGALMGLASGGLLALLLRPANLVPEKLQNTLTLSLVLALSQLANALVPESGIVTAVTAGLVVGNTRTPVGRELREFKEQLTELLIAMLFVLLAADVRHAEAMQLGLPGLLVVAVLMLVVRPLNVLACTWGSALGWRDKAFLAWLAPRGIVAAAVASLFDDRLTAAGLGGGQDMRALVFLVIFVTVVTQGLSGGLVARWLGVRRPREQGYLILGAGSLGRTLARSLRGAGEEIVLVDADAGACAAAEREELRVLHGNPMEERLFLAAAADTRRAAVATLPNGAQNLLFARRARREFEVPRAVVALQKGQGALDATLVREAGASVLFGGETDVELWAVRLRRELAGVEAWTLAPPSAVDEEATAGLRELPDALLPVVLVRDGRASPWDGSAKLRAGDTLHFLVFSEQRESAVDWLKQAGWQPHQSREPAADGAA